MRNKNSSHRSSTNPPSVAIDHRSSVAGRRHSAAKLPPAAGRRLPVGDPTATGCRLPPPVAEAVSHRSPAVGHQLPSVTPPVAAVGRRSPAATTIVCCYRSSVHHHPPVRCRLKGRNFVLLSNEFLFLE